MPWYEFACGDCGHRFEQHRKATEKAIPRCPKCRGRARKVFGAVGIIFKGSGFHSTDYRKPEDNRGREAEASAAKPAGAGDTKSTEAD